MTDDLLLPADLLPGVIGGWCGPAEVWFSLPGSTGIVSQGRWVKAALDGDPTSRESIRLDPTRREVQHLLADHLRSLGHEVGPLLPRALGGRVEDVPGACPACEGRSTCPGMSQCWTCENTGRATIPAAEVSAALLVASVRGVVAGKGMVRGVLGEWRPTDPDDHDDDALGWRRCIWVWASDKPEVRTVNAGHEAGKAWCDAHYLGKGWALTDPTAAHGVRVPFALGDDGREAS